MGAYLDEHFSRRVVKELFGQTFRAGTQFPTSVWVSPTGVITDVKYGPMSRDFLDQRLGDS